MNTAIFNCLDTKKQLEIQAMMRYIKDGEKAQRGRK